MVRNETDRIHTLPIMRVMMMQLYTIAFRLNCRPNGSRLSHWNMTPASSLIASFVVCCPKSAMILWNAPRSPAKTLAWSRSALPKELSGAFLRTTGHEAHRSAKPMTVSGRISADFRFPHLRAPPPMNHIRSWPSQSTLSLHSPRSQRRFAL